MPVVILHSHLHPGGVTRVIENQITALRNAGETDIRILVGVEPDTNTASPWSVPVVVHPELDYLAKDLSKDDYASKLERIRAILDEVISPGTVLHAHNINLGKNPLVNVAVAERVLAGQPFFNHCHDFAEDNRPANWQFLTDIVQTQFGCELKDVLYSTAANVAYAVLNRRDAGWLVQYGCREAAVHEMPNPIPDGPETYHGREPAELRRILGIKNDLPCMVYPVRVIERKNIGELLLLSAVLKGRVNVLVTLPPRNPEEIVHYDAWRAFAEELALPITFEVGTKLEFEEVMHLADVVVSTSLREGFGMAFLEPWTFGNGVVGRDLPEITADFKAQGLDLSGCYASLIVDGGQDFKQLSVDEQRAMIRRYMDKTALGQALIDAYGLEAWLEPVDDTVVAHNQAVISKHYSIDAYGNTLRSIYESLL